ncbi:MAG: ABC transporter substrate-binding protein [Lachnospiraceae bacterium]
MRKKIVSMLMAVTLVATMLAACGNSEQASTGTTTESVDTTSTESADAEVEDEEMAEINIAWMTLGVTDTSKTDAVVEAINAITESEINVHVNMEFLDPATYGTQIPMEIQANEKLDLLMYTPVPGASYTSFKGQNQLMDISDLLDEYGSDIQSELGDFLQGTTTTDGVYGVAANRLLASSLYVIMRKDVLDQLGLTEKAQNMTTWAEYEEILQAVKENTDLAPVANSDAEGSVLTVMPFFTNGDNFSDGRGFDTLGDTYNMIYAGTDGKVGCVYFSDEYASAVTRTADWYQKGLIYKDAGTAQDFADTLIKNNVAFSYVVTGELGAAETKEASTGYEIVATKVTDAVLSTGSTLKFGFAVPITAEEPEAAVKMLNLMYSSSDIQNILAWGVEGRDWVEANGEATYPDGVTAETVTYHMSDFLNGNQFITMPWEGNGADFRAVQKAEQDSAPISEYMGFSFDATEYETELTACFNVVQQYKAGLGAGSYSDVEGTLKEFQDKMTAAGIDKVIAAYQEQLDAFMASK